jgi:glycosyltransferase involved in cell wall biosynthesis
MHKNTEINLEEKERPKICIISFPMPATIFGNIFLIDLVKILEPICEGVCVVTSNIPKDSTFSEKIRIQDVKTAMHFRETIYPRWWSAVFQFLKIVIIQMKMCWTLIKISKEMDIVIVYVGGANLFLPVLMAKLLRKKLITSAIGLGSRSYRAYNKGLFSMSGTFSVVFRVLERANFYLSDRIIVESGSVIDFLGLDKYRQKVVASGARYIDTNLFQINKDLRERKNLVGYIGRLDEGKGVMNFVKAIPLILEKQTNLKFFIGGHGLLHDRIKKELRTNNLSQKVELVGWIHHDRVANSLNELKLLVLYHGE